MTAYLEPIRLSPSHMMRIQGGIKSAKRMIHRKFRRNYEVLKKKRVLFKEPSSHRRFLAPYWFLSLLSHRMVERKASQLKDPKDDLLSAKKSKRMSGDNEC